MAWVGLSSVTLPVFAKKKIDEIAASLTAAADTRRSVLQAMSHLGQRTSTQSMPPQSIQNIVRNYAQAFADGKIQRDCFSYVDQQLSRLDDQLPQPWLSVALTIKAMNLLRYGEIGAFLACPADHAAPLVGWLQRHLREGDVKPFKSSAAWDVADSSILAEDRALQSLCAGDPGPSPAEPSWLYRYIHWRLLMLSNPAELQPLADTLRQTLVEQQAAGSIQFPVTYPDSKQLMDELETSKVKAWL